MPDDIDEDTPDSGPFCRHFADPSDCDEVCGRCGHKCYEHCRFESECNISDCSCEQWVEED